VTAPIVLSTYPADKDSGIPIGISIEVQFDKGIDLEIAKGSVILYGADFDRTSGPEQAAWINLKTGENPFYLKSPGFRGTVPLDFRVEYYDLDTLQPVSSGVITSSSDEAGGTSTPTIGHRLIATPQEKLAANTLYNLFILGDPSEVGSGISKRTVFDVELSNPVATGLLYIYGTYTRGLADRVVMEVTRAGDIGTAQYKWWYVSEGPAAARLGHVTSRRYRRLEDGLQIRFNGSAFVLGDTYAFNVEPIERMETNTQLTFTTNDGSFSEPPESPSTPAVAEPPSTILPPVGGGSPSQSTLFDVLGMVPEDRSFNVNMNTRQITITFTDNIDEDSITDESVKLYLVSAVGQYADSMAPRILSKKLTVTDNVLVIDF
jgi:hypothetical protein